MFRNIVALLAGLIFGIGLTLSQMLNPAKVLAFLDILGDWDPSLAFVMGGGLLVTFIGYSIVLKRDQPHFEAGYQLPGTVGIDPRLAGGAMLFGIGWGLVGLCPGPAIAAITIGGAQAFIFLAAMAAGMVIFAALERLTGTAQPSAQSHQS